MKNLRFIVVITGLLCFISYTSGAQIFDPVKWSYAVKKTSAKEAVIFIKATIADGWHIYSLKQAEGGPLKTSVSFKRSASYALLGSTDEPIPITEFEKSFGIDVKYFEHAVIFQQKIKLLSSKCAVSLAVKFMACNEHQCLPPEMISFSIPVGQ